MSWESSWLERSRCGQAPTGVQGRGTVFVWKVLSYVRNTGGVRVLSCEARGDRECCRVGAGRCPFSPMG